MAAEPDYDAFRREIEEMRNSLNRTSERVQHAQANVEEGETHCQQMRDNITEFSDKFKEAMDDIMDSIASSVTQGLPSATDVAESVRFHGHCGNQAWALPQCVTKSDTLARSGYTNVKANEFLDDPQVLSEKVDLLCEMILAAKREGPGAVVYTGAGISTAAGVRDYASKAQGSVAVSKQLQTSKIKLEEVTQLQPTLSHRVIAAMEKEGYVPFWLQQNHDGLAQKAGFPQDKLNELHGSWHDREFNPVVPMTGKLRPDLARWMVEWSKKADFVLALGTSFSGMAADLLCRRAASKALCRFGANIPSRRAARESPQPELLSPSECRTGVCIVSLQQTPLDGAASLRIFAKIDDVMALVAERLRLNRSVIEDSTVYPVPLGFKWIPPSGEILVDDRDMPNRAKPGGAASTSMERGNNRSPRASAVQFLGEEEAPSSPPPVTSAVSTSQRSSSRQRTDSSRSPGSRNRSRSGSRSRVPPPKKR